MRTMEEAPRDLAGRCVLVTGAASGIGGAAAERLVHRGAHVAMLDRDAAVTGLAAALDEERARGWRVDVGDEPAVERAIGAAADWLGGLDALVHCAGIMRGQRLDLAAVTSEIWDEVLRTNLTGTFHVVKHAIGRMPHGGTVVLVSSVAGVTQGSGSYAYGASKGGMHGLALTLERHLHERGIRVVEVLPDTVDTPLLRGSLVEGEHNTGTAPATGPMIDPGAIGDVLAFLVSPAGAAVVGTVRTR